jgi:hypothetical protein
MTLTKHQMNIRKFGRVAVAGPTVFFLCWLVAGLTQPHFRFVRDDESALAAIGAAHPWITIIGDSLLGVSMLALAIGLPRLTAGRRALTAMTVLSVAGLATITQAVVREDCIDRLGQCAASGRTAGRTWLQPVHDTASLIAFLGVFAVAFIFVRAFREVGAPQMATYSAVTSIGGVILLFGYAAVSDTAIGGLTEFVVLIVALGWMVLTGRFLATRTSAT